VQHKLHKLQEEDHDATIPPLTVWQDGQSFRVNCLDGHGVQTLKSQLILMAHNLPWWREVIPEQYVRLQQAILARVKNSATTWLTWAAYVELSEENGINFETFGKDKDMHLKVCTTFLHENATIKYFGAFDTILAQIAEAKTILLQEAFAHADAESSGMLPWSNVVAAFHELGVSEELLLRRMARMAGKFDSLNRDRFVEIGLAVVGLQGLCLEAVLSHVDNSVFVQSKWIIDSLKGLIRHDRSALLTYFGQLQESDDQRVWLRRVSRLAAYGILHDELVPFIWPGGITPLSHGFWEWARNEDEGELWSTDVAVCTDDYNRVLALLYGCDIIHRISNTEHVAPGLLANKQQGRVDARILQPSDSSTITHNIVYSGSPPGFFDRLLVRSRRRYSHMDFSSGSAALYGRGLKTQLFFKLDDTTQQARLTFLTSTHEQMLAIREDLEGLCRFFRGMRVLADDGAPTGIHAHAHGRRDAELDDQRAREPIQVRILAAQPTLDTAIKGAGLGDEVLVLLHAEGITTAKQFLGIDAVAPPPPPGQTLMMRKMSRTMSRKKSSSSSVSLSMGKSPKNGQMLGGLGHATSADTLPDLSRSVHVRFSLPVYI